MFKHFMVITKNREYKRFLASLVKEYMYEKSRAQDCGLWRKIPRGDPRCGADSDIQRLGRFTSISLLSNVLFRVEIIYIRCY